MFASIKVLGQIELCFNNWPRSSQGFVFFKLGSLPKMRNEFRLQELKDFSLTTKGNNTENSVVAI